jgi:hypothetical protein
MHVDFYADEFVDTSPLFINVHQPRHTGPARNSVIYRPCAVYGVKKQYRKENTKHP